MVSVMELKPGSPVALETIEKNTVCEGDVCWVRVLSDAEMDELFGRSMSGRHEFRVTRLCGDSVGIEIVEAEARLTGRYSFMPCYNSEVGGHYLRLVPPEEGLIPLIVGSSYLQNEW